MGRHVTEPHATIRQQKHNLFWQLTKYKAVELRMNQYKEACTRVSGYIIEIASENVILSDGKSMPFIRFSLLPST
jgi:hypothetical protein